jgi:hypothetical protein
MVAGMKMKMAEDTMVKNCNNTTQHNTTHTNTNAHTQRDETRKERRGNNNDRRDMHMEE